MYAAIVFDLDNTLINRQRALTRWLRDTIKRLRPDLSVAERREVVKDAVDADAWGKTPMRAMQALDSRGIHPAGQLLQLLRQQLHAHVRHDARVHNALRKIAAAWPIAIASNGGESTQRSKLIAARLLQHPWATITISGAVGAEKPQRAFFDHVACALQKHTSEDGDVLMVGDDVHADIAGAHQYGWDTCWISWGRPQPTCLESRSHGSIKHVWDLPRFLAMKSARDPR